MRNYLNKNNKFFYYAIPVLLLGALIIFYYNTQKSQENINLVAHTELVLAQNNEVQSNIFGIESSSRGYLLTGNSVFLQPIASMIDSLNNNLDRLIFLVKDNEIQHQRANILKSKVNQRIILLQQNYTTFAQKPMDFAPNIDLLTDSKAMTDTIRQIIGAMNVEEFRLLRIRKDAYDHTIQVNNYIFIALWIFILTVSLLFFTIFHYQKAKFSNAGELENKVRQRTAALLLATEQIQQKDHEIALSKYNKMFLTAFSDKFVGNEDHAGFFDSVVQFLVDVTNLDYAFIAKFKDESTDKFTMETIAFSQNGQLVENFDYTIKNGPCGEIIYGSLYSYAEGCKTIFPDGQFNKAYQVEGYIGFPLNDAKGHVIGLVAVMHHAPINDSENISSILTIVAKRVEMEFEKIRTAQILTNNQVSLELKNMELEQKNDFLNQKNVEIEESKEKLQSEYARSLIEASHDPLVTISTDGHIMDMNRAMIEVSENTREQLKGADFKKYFTVPDKAELGYKKVFKDGFVVDYPLTLKDGKLTDVLFNGSVFKDGAGNVLGAVVVARDISAQNKIEKDLIQSLKEVSDYKYALDASSIVEVTDAKGVIKYVNNNFCLISQYSAEELIGKTHKIINSGYHDSKMIEDLWTTISSGKIWRGELKNQAKDGTAFWVLSTIVPFLDDVGKPYQYVAIRTDITDQKRVETELIEAKVMAEIATTLAEEQQVNAENAMRSKQQFLSNMSHEIRTPLNAILGFTKVVLKTDLTAKQKEYLNAIKMSGDTLIVLINDILDLAKVDAGKMSFEHTPFKMQASMVTITHLFEPKIHEKNLRLIRDYDTSIPEVLLGDPIRLHQIILNLISNAVKFTKKGYVSLSIQLIREDEKQVTVEFSVVDTGIGIAADKIETVFENFQQASSDTARLFGGTGLGLAIAKQLVEQQGGTIQVKSVLNEGSTFSFRLDFQKASANAQLVEDILMPDMEPQNIKVLVVEDIPLNQLLMKTILDDFGFEREIAENGKIAIEKLKTESYDIILMDLQMPEMNGFEATHYIRNTLHSNTPIIALTADVTTVDLQKCTDAGMNDYIAKPIDEKVLYSKIVHLIKKSAQMSLTAQVESSQAAEMRYTDLQYLTKRTKNNSALMSAMIHAYLKQTPPLVTSLRESVVQKDWDTLYMTVHKMIPSFAIMGIHNDFEKIAHQIQQYARAQQELHKISDLIVEIETVCLGACKELELELNRLQNGISE